MSIESLKARAASCETALLNHPTNDRLRSSLRRTIAQCNRRIREAEASGGLVPEPSQLQRARSGAIEKRIDQELELSNAIAALRADAQRKLHDQ